MRSSRSRGIPPGYLECGARDPHQLLGRAARCGHVLGLRIAVPEAPFRHPRETVRDGARRQQRLVRELAVHCVAKRLSPQNRVVFRGVCFSSVALQRCL